MGRSFKEIFLIVFPLTGLLFGAMTYFLLNLKTLGHSGMMMAVGLGFACGIVFGVGIGYFVRSNEIEIPVGQGVDMYTRLQIMLMNMGYRPDIQVQKIVTFHPTLRAGIFADMIRVEMLTGLIKVAGPVYHLDKLRSQLGI